MPSLPTSLLVVLLAVAWLVVLVPMVAKRREHVPENEEEGARMRVLRRDAAGRGRRRAILSRTAMARTSASKDAEADDRADLGDSENIVAEGADTDAHGVSARGRGEDAVTDDADTGDVFRDRGDSGVMRTPYRDDVPAEDGAKYAGVRVGRAADRAEGDWGGENAVRPVPIRPGRGGYDPAAADRARAYRFRQRRRVALVLLLVTLGGAGAGLWGVGLGYAVAVAGGVVLALYLAYLRRQVRIEDVIRRRRAERLERARQIRPSYRPSVAEQVYAHRTGEEPRPGAVGDYQVRSHVRQSVPSTGYGYGEPVDLEDSDPAFDDLEYYRPAAYRRRAG